MFLVGVTGGIASGKSTVSNILRNECGCVVIDADRISREIFEPGEKAYKNVVAVFGPGVLDENKEINRSALGDLIFNDSALRKKLNSITHKEIRLRMLWKILKAFLCGHRFVVLDIPLLIETKAMLPLLKHIVVVYTKPSVQKSRLMFRDEFDEKQAVARIDSQMPIDEKLSYATKVIDNNGSIENTNFQVHSFYKMLKSTFSLNIYEWVILLLSGSYALFYYFH